MLAEVLRSLLEDQRLDGALKGRIADARAGITARIGARLSK